MGTTGEVHLTLYSTGMWFPEKMQDYFNAYPVMHMYLCVEFDLAYMVVLSFPLTPTSIKIHDLSELKEVYTIINVEEEKGWTVQIWLSFSINQCDNDNFHRKSMKNYLDEGLHSNQRCCRATSLSLFSPLIFHFYEY